MKLKNLLLVVLLMAFSFVFVACSDGEISISLETDFTTYVGDTAQLTPQVRGTDAEVVFLFESEKPTVVSVDANGKATALKAGSAKVTVTIKDNPDVKAVVTIKVEEPPITTIILEADLTTVVGETVVLTPNVAGIDEAKFLFESKDPTIASVDEVGKVLALKAGTVEITVSLEENPEITGVVKLRVIDAAEMTISLGADFATLVGEQSKLTPVANEVAGEVEFLFASEDPTVASVDDEGNVLALKVGTTVITVSLEEYPGVSASVSVNVVDKNLEDFAPEEITILGDQELAVGGQTKLNTIVSPAGSYHVVLWESSNPNIVSVASDGMLLGHSVGTATITAKSAVDESVVKTYEVEVVPSAQQIVDDAIEFLVAELPEFVSESFTLPVYANEEVTVVWKNYINKIITEYNLVSARDRVEKLTLIVSSGNFEKQVELELKLVIDPENNQHTNIPITADAINGYMLVLGDEVAGDLNLPVFLNGVNIVWASDKPNYISADGKFTRPDNDENVKLTAAVGGSDLREVLEFNLVAKGYTKEAKVQYILEEGTLKPFVNAETTMGFDFPEVTDKFSATLTWVSNNPEVLDNDGKYVDLNIAESTVVSYTVTISYDAIGHEFEETVEIEVTAHPLNDVGRAALAFLSSDFEVSHVAYGAPGIPNKLTDLPSSLEGHDVTIAWHGKEGEFNTEMEVLIPRVLYTETEIYATFSKEGETDIIISCPVNIGLLASKDDIAFTERSDKYSGLDYDIRNGMPVAEDGTGTAYKLGFENFYFKSHMTKTINGVEITKDWYFFFAVGNYHEFTTDHLDEEEMKFVDPTKSGAVLEPQWSSATRIYKNTTDQAIYVKVGDLQNLGAQAGGDTYKPFVLDVDGFVTTVGTPGMAFAPVDFTEYEIPAGGLLVCPGYIQSGAAEGKFNLDFFGDTLGNKVDVLTLTGEWAFYADEGLERE